MVLQRSHGDAAREHPDADHALVIRRREEHVVGADAQVRDIPQVAPQRVEEQRLVHAPHLYIYIYSFHFVSGDLEYEEQILMLPQWHTVIILYGFNSP